MVCAVRRAWHEQHCGRCGRLCQRWLLRHLRGQQRDRQCRRHCERIIPGASRPGHTARPAKSMSMPVGLVTGGGGSGGGAVRTRGTHVITNDGTISSTDGSAYLPMALATCSIQGSSRAAQSASLYRFLQHSDVLTTVNTGTISGGPNPLIAVGPNFFAYDATGVSKPIASSLRAISLATFDWGSIPAATSSMREPSPAASILELAVKSPTRPLGPCPG